jgi:hypothetical protein
VFLIVFSPHLSSLWKIVNTYFLFLIGLYIVSALCNIIVFSPHLSSLWKIVNTYFLFLIRTLRSRFPSPSVNTLEITKMLTWSGPTCSGSRSIKICHQLIHRVDLQIFFSTDSF